MHFASIAALATALFD